MDLRELKAYMLYTDNINYMYVIHSLHILYSDSLVIRQNCSN